jgi:hypothetical protein
MDWWIWIAISLPFVTALLERLPITGIHWGGSDTEHPGWWWTRKETVFMRRVGQKDE